MSKLILFDFDGVLVDSIEIFSTAVNVAGRHLHQPVSFTVDDLRNIKRMSIPEIVSAASVDPNLSDVFIQTLDQELYRQAEQFQLFPGIDETILELNKAGRLAIVSASSVAVLQRVLARFDLLGYFSDVVGGDVPGTKAEKIAALVKKYNTSPSQTCMIGDTVSDIEHGKAANVLTVAVSWGWHHIDWIRQAEPDCEAFVPTDLIRIVEVCLRPEPMTVDPTSVRCA